MKRLFLLCLLLLFATGSAPVPLYDPHRDGALADLAILVVDDEGIPVDGADLCVSFATGSVDDVERTGQTDKAGRFHARCETTSSIWILAQKEGYYRTRLHVDAQNVPYSVATETRKWSAGPVDTKVVLKKIRNPANLILKGALYLRAPIPATNTLMGFDLELFDWCPPYGLGVHDDLQLEYDFWRSSTNWFQVYSRLTLTMTNGVDGLYLEPVDAYSALKRCYRANPNATYQRRLEFVYDRRTGEVALDLPMPEDQYMVLRTRTKTNEVGEVVSANYALLFENGECGAGVISMRVGFNPTPNDTNLECTDEPHERRRNATQTRRPPDWKPTPPIQ